MTSNPKAKRALAPTPTDKEFDAIDAIRKAYMACNAAPGPLEYELSVGMDYEPSTMGFIAAAGRTAWIELGVPEEYNLWGVMGDSGENARYVFNLYAEGTIVAHRSY